MTPVQFFRSVALLTLVVFVTSCSSPAPAPSTAVPIKPTEPTSPTVSPSSTPKQSPEDQLASQIDDYVTKLVKQDRFSGSILIARDGKVLLSKGYGMANFELGVPNTPQTKFRVGSITKQFTAIATLQLQQQGKLSVKDPICKYVEACPKTWESITIHQLLTHTSGIPNYKYDLLDVSKTKTPYQLINLFRDLPLDFEPAKDWRYSNSGYVVLGHIIERVSNQPYADFLRSNIFKPLSMSDTGYDNSRIVLKNRAAGYSTASVNANYIDMSIPYAAGGLYSTVGDLLKWDEALNGDILLAASLRETMFTPLVPVPQSTLSYGYGWIVDKQFDRLLIRHGGNVPGFAAEFGRFPNDKVTIIVLSNFEDLDTGKMFIDIAGMIFDK